MKYECQVNDLYGFRHIGYERMLVRIIRMGILPIPTTLVYIIISIVLGRIGYVARSL